MTNEKARDFFSAYNEGTLEAGLCVSLEQKFKADGELRREYDSFVRVMKDLDALQTEEIEIPHDLHELISARLDKHIYDRKQTARPSWNTWLRSLAFAGVGALAIVGAVLTLNNRGGTGPDTAGVGAPSPSKDMLSTAVSSGGVAIDFRPTSTKTLIIVNESKTSRVVVGDKDTPEFKTLLSNSLPNASVFAVEVQGEAGGKYIALPGRVRSPINHGDGTVVDLAKAVSAYFRMPVALDTQTPNERTTWTFTSVNVVDETSKALPNYTVTLLSQGMLEIAQK